MGNFPTNIFRVAMDYSITLLKSDSLKSDSPTDALLAILSTLGTLTEKVRGSASFEYIYRY